MPISIMDNSYRLLSQVVLNDLYSYIELTRLNVTGMHWTRSQAFASMHTLDARPYKQTSSNFSGLGHATVLFMAISVCTPCTTLANSDDDLFNLDLDALSELRVSIGSALATSEPERIRDTPVIATRYETANMRHLGLQDLEALLNFVPGVVVQDSAIGTKGVMIRGIVEAFNQKVLFLLDGVPYWQPAHGDFPILAMPFTYIERVEVIRGPGAVIYGTNASGGVINVITKQDSNNEMAASLGNLGERQASGFYGHQFSTFQIQTGFHFQTETGYSETFDNRPVPTIYPPDTPTSTEIQKADKGYSLWSKAQSSTWSLGLHHFRSEMNGLAAAASTLNESTLEYEGTLLYGNTRVSSPIGDIQLYADVNNFYLNIPTQSLLGFNQDGEQTFANDGNDNNRIRTGIKNEVIVGPAIKWLNGIEFESRSTAHYQNYNTNHEPVTTSLESNITEEHAFYSQFDGHWGANRMVLGARYINNEQAGSSWLPRIALVRQLSNQQTLKALYSVGFNAPNFVQQYINIAPNVIKGDENLKAEKIKTVELAYSYQASRHLFVANVFQLTAEDFIFRSTESDGQVKYTNSNSYARHGFELDYRHHGTAQDIYINGSWLRQGNERIARDHTALFVPKYNINIGGSYILNAAWRLGSSIRYISERDNAKSITLLNANVQWKAAQWQSNLTFENLLNNKQFHPDIQNFDRNRHVPSGSNDTRLQLECRYIF